MLIEDINYDSCGDGYMTSSELVEYIEEKHLEYQMLSILMFNDYGFAFLPVVNPALIIHGGRAAVEIIGFDKMNLFSNGHRSPTFPLPDSIKHSDRLNRFAYHPEHLRAYIIRWGDKVGVELLYSRKQKDAARDIRNAAFESFSAINDICSIDQFNSLFSRSRIIQKERYRKGQGTYDYIKLIEDDIVSASIVAANETPSKIYSAFCIRMYTAWQEIFFNRFSIADFTIDLSDSLALTVEYPPIPSIKTPLDLDVSILHHDDEIPAILYRIAYDIQATKLIVATGYMYESGLNQLLPSFACVHDNDEHSIELTVGDLYRYASGKKSRSPNRATVGFLNILLERTIVQHLYTLPSTFYHGKFYYISNGSVSYCIVGSSNVTISAYQRNREFDIIYRFENTDGISPLEQQFLDWYENLKAECVELFNLDESLFPSNLNEDEEGTSNSNSILRSITQEEERERFRFLESFCPSKVEEGLFRGKFYQPFRDYLLFLYPERGISILERFSYGMSSYVFSTVDIEYLKQLLICKSKEQVKNTDAYIANVDHDESYQFEISRIFDESKDFGQGLD